MKWFPVEITFEDMQFQDEIQGINEYDALKNARWNWEYTTNITIIKEEVQ